MPRDKFSFPSVNELPPSDGEGMCIVKDIIKANSNSFQSSILSILSRAIEGKNFNNGYVFEQQPIGFSSFIKIGVRQIPITEAEETSIAPCLQPLAQLLEAILN